MTFAGQPYIFILTATVCLNDLRRLLCFSARVFCIYINENTKHIRVCVCVSVCWYTLPGASQVAPG